MKQIKRLTTLALAVMLLLSLATTAFAAEGDIKISIVSSASGASVTGHTYEVYQIFTGDVAEDGKTLSNVAFGKNYTPDMTVDQAMAALKEMNGAEAAEYLKDNLNTAVKFGELNDRNDHEITAPTGYYLIIDVSENLPDTETASAYILQALEDKEIKSKHDSAPKTYKKIDDVNDSTGDGIAIEWHDSADHDIGDKIPFQLNAVIPSSIDAFREDDVAYPFTFHDVEELGLAFDSITSVYVMNGETKTALTSGYTLVAEGLTDSCTFEVQFEDLTAIDAVQPGSVLVVEYKSVLTEDAIIGEEGNVNKMRGEFRNYNKPTEPAFTPWDYVIAFTYKLEANKYANEVKEGNKLTGAGFTLYKWYGTAESGEWRKIGDEITGEALTVFEWKGIDDGKYKLEETTTPDGYNTIDPIEFTVTAEHDVEWTNQERNNVLTSLSGVKATGEVREIVFTPDKEEGSLSTDVVNKSGTVLPETGGMGTTIFYALGGMMVLVAVVLLVTKKRMASAE